MDVFINSAEAITAQNTFDTDDFLSTVENPENNYFSVINPKYKEYINPKQLRRMSKIIRMGVACSIKVLEKAEINQPDAIIIGTGLGCLTDTIKFLDNMIENNETLLNPTAFIQSTHNTVSGQIALVLGCKNYNFTFSQQSASFETALLDAFIKLQDKELSNILLGGLDEITERTYSLLEKSECVKEFSQNIYNSNTKSFVAGEGASFFTLSNNKSDKNIAKIIGLSHFDTDNGNDLPKGLKEVLSKENLSVNDIDIVVSGKNGDSKICEKFNLIDKIFQQSTIVNYKHIIGEYDTASGFAMWLASKIIQKQLIPKSLIKLDLKKKNIKNILIHNYNKQDKHSFILLSKC